VITVILPTANRPAMLRTALESVAGQTALDKVSRIFVSENGGGHESEAVCAEFSTLPITYLHRVPATPLDHAKIIVRECLVGEMTAFLHDDDWWTPTHLSHALDALRRHPQAAAYGSGYYVVSAESSMLNCSNNLFPWFGSSYAPLGRIWELSRLNVLMAELLGTIAHYSSMVVRTEAMRKSAFVYDLDNPFDNDRMLSFALSVFGPLLFNPVPGVFVRNHPVQHCQSFKKEDRIAHMCRTTRWMVETSGKSWEAISTAFFKRMSLCPHEAFDTLKKLSLEPWCVPELARNAALPVAQTQPREMLVAAGR